jgi:hypothetical protein
MAQTKRKRRRKHRGTPAGTIERPASDVERRRKPQTKEEKRAEARRRRLERLDRPPSWSAAFQRAGIAAALFGVLVIVLFDESPATALTLAAFMLVIYVPFGYLFDSAMYRFRQRRKQAGRAPDGR